MLENYFVLILAHTHIHARTPRLLNCFRSVRRWRAASVSVFNCGFWLDSAWLHAGTRTVWRGCGSARTRVCVQVYVIGERLERHALRAMGVDFVCVYSLFFVLFLFLTHGVFPFLFYLLTVNEPKRRPICVSLCPFEWDRV